MDEDRIARALARIEAAAGRIEAAAQSAPSAAADPRLVGKYDALRREAGAALADLDALIGSLRR